MIYVWAAAWEKVNRSPVFAYFFSHSEPGADSAKWAAFHSSEIPYAFATLDAAPQRPFTDVDRKLSLDMSSYWINFVRTGNPNGSALPTWPTFDTTSLAVLELREPIGTRALLTREKLEAYKALVASGGQLGMF